MGKDGRVDTPRLVALGRIAVAAAEIEYHLLRVLYELVDPDFSIGEAEVGAPSFTRARRRVRPLAVSSGLSDAATEQVLEYVDQAKEAMDARDTALHSHWIDEGVQLQGRKSRVLYSVTIAHLNDTAALVENAAEAMSAAWPRIIVDLGRLERVGEDRRFPERTLPHAPEVQERDPPAPRPHAHHVWGVFTPTAGLGAGPAPNEQTAPDEESLD